LAVLDPQKKHDVVINLQGDIPFIDPGALAACASLLAREPDCDIATLIAPETKPADRSDADLPKAVMAMQGPHEGRALYFTRSTLYGQAPVWLHIGIYAYRRAALERFNSAAPSPLEQRERLEQLRALEMGLSIWASVMDSFPISVDTPADLAAACAFAARA
jgi:3-deoxy-manno-octulosonate cytidylyltransferase (CMP-KDO synthetase)